jgi:integrase
MRKETENLKSFFIFCVGQGWISANPARGLKCPEDKSPGALPFDRAEMKVILAAVDKISNRNPIAAHRARVRARALILAALWTGLRIADLAQLRRSQYDGNSGYLTLRHTQKTKVPIRVKLRQEAADALRALPVEHPDFYCWNGTSDLNTVCTSLQETLGTISRLAGIHVHAHRFRDTFASELLLPGADLRTVQLLLGHKSIKTTEKHYAHFVFCPPGSPRQSSRGA